MFHKGRLSAPKKDDHQCHQPIEKDLQQRKILLRKTVEHTLNL